MIPRSTMIVTNDSSSRNCSPEYSLAVYQTGGAFLVGMNILTSLFAVTGNLLVFMTVFNTPRMTSSFQYFVANLAIADLTIALICQPLLVVLILGRISSKCFTSVFFVFRVVGNVSFYVSLLTLTVIALDRCLFVVAKFNYKNTMTVGKKIVLAIIWVFSEVFCGMRLTMDKKLTSNLALAVIGLCYSTVLVCYAVVYFKVFKYHKLMAAEKVNAQVKNFPRVIVMILITFTVGLFLLFYHNLTQPGNIHGFVYYGSATAALSIGCVNPVFYCFNNTLNRRVFKVILRRFFLFVLRKPKPENSRRWIDDEYNTAKQGSLDVI